MERYREADREVAKSKLNLNSNRKRQGRPPKPLTKEKYGHLTPIEYLGGYWECECDCGWYTITTRTALESGRTKSCGCGRFEWIEVEPVPGSKKQPRYNFFMVVAMSHSQYLCECTCGKEFIIKKEDVHETLSCGCIVIGKRIPLAPFGEKSISSIQDLEFYKIWKNIKVNYRRQGVPIDSKWKSSFIWFLAWSINQPMDAFNRPMAKPYLHRKDCNNGYFPWNCEITYDKGNRGRKADPQPRI